ncbi:aldehyde dehydrogenase family protein [Gordonia sp. LSe1-13]|uniref:Aldehyde dehydrogenase family protein n=2 Tax=Gordonia sesuvii TaxID=3116777 RepID=A0ABU7M9H6_9ACTN|nr:aldehyde dehydrogenase family protein [Gordonia sp. LSe1-13]
MTTGAATAVEQTETSDGGRAQLLIGGRLVDAASTFESINPATGEVLGSAPNAGVDEANAAIAAAREAFEQSGWATDVALRVRCLEQLHQALLDHLEELRELTIAEVGATRMLTKGNQLEAPIEIVRYYADLLKTHSFTEELGSTEIRGQEHRRWTEREPAGVVSAIIAYNYPNQLALAKLAPALAAGCTVVLKGAPDTPLITLALARIIAENTDIPAGVVNVLTSSEVEVGQAMVAHRDIDVVTFTGSTPVGKQIMADAAGSLKRVFLELGGKSALIVLDDADLMKAAQFAAFTICTHSGQGCALTTRLIVPRDKHDQLAQMIGGMFDHVTIGDPGDESNYMGPLISERQRDKVDGLVRRAVDAGATLVRGGKRIEPGFFYSATLLADVDPDSEIAQEEIFGPVLVMIPHDGDDHAIEIANNSRYGLSGGVLTADRERGLAVGRAIRTGTFSINGGNYFTPDVPFGGYKESGIGREMGVAGLHEFTEIKSFAEVVDA